MDESASVLHETKLDSVELRLDLTASTEPKDLVIFGAPNFLRVKNGVISNGPFIRSLVQLCCETLARFEESDIHFARPRRANGELMELWVNDLPNDVRELYRFELKLALEDRINRRYDEQRRIMTRLMERWRRFT